MSATPKWTPGPWRAVREELRGGAYWSVCSDHACLNDGLHEADENGKANCQLQAAAPELYTALNACLGLLTGDMDGDLPHDRDPADMARAALAKARGEQP